MLWYRTRIASRDWPVTCPKCGKEWSIPDHVPGYISARDAHLQGRMARITCDECRRKGKQTGKPQSSS